MFCSYYNFLTLNTEKNNKTHSVFALNLKYSHKCCHLLPSCRQSSARMEVFVVFLSGDSVMDSGRGATERRGLLGGSLTDNLPALTTAPSQTHQNIK